MHLCTSPPLSYPSNHRCAHGGHWKPYYYEYDCFFDSRIKDAKVYSFMCFKGHFTDYVYSNNRSNDASHNLHHSANSHKPEVFH